MRKLILDSSLATNGNSSEPLWRFSTGIRVAAIRLNTAIIPLSFYNVLADNNVVSFSDNNATRTATLTNGTYSAVELSDELARAMSAAGSQTYTVSFHPVSGKLTVSAPGQFKFLMSQTTASKVLGLRSDTVPATNITLHQPVALTRCQLILLNSPQLSSRGSVLYAGRESLNIIEAIPVQQDLGTIMVHQSQMPEFVDIPDAVISEISIRLLDSTTCKPLDLNGETFQMILDVE